MNNERSLLQQRNKVRIHRYVNCVAFDVSGDQSTETIYIASEVAHAFGSMLIEYANDIDKNSFADSPLQTVVIDSTD